MVKAILAVILTALLLGAVALLIGRVFDVPFLRDSAWIVATGALAGGVLAMVLGRGRQR